MVFLKSLPVLIVFSGPLPYGCSEYAEKSASCASSFAITVGNHYSLVSNSESGSRQWHFLLILFLAIVFLGHRGINKLLLSKMHICFLSQRLWFCLRVS